jgi:hypothetical protein
LFAYQFLSRGRGRRWVGGSQASRWFELFKERDAVAGWALTAAIGRMSKISFGSFRPLTKELDCPMRPV